MFPRDGGGLSVVRAVTDQLKYQPWRGNMGDKDVGRLDKGWARL